MNNDDLLKVILADDDDQIIKLLVQKHRVKNTTEERVEIESGSMKRWTDMEGEQDA